MDSFRSEEKLPGDPDPEGAGDPREFMRVIAPDEQRPKLKGLWLLKGLIPKTGIGAIYGPSDSGKSFVAIDLAMALSRGVPWRGRRSEQAAVFYLCPDGGDMVQNRIEAYKIWCAGSVDHKVFLAPDGIDLLDPDGAKKVIETINRHENFYDVRFGMVVVDTASRTMPGGDENASKDITRFIDSLARIGSGRRVLVVVHHTPKTDGKVLRGHSALHGACDFELNVCERTITVAKQRDGESGQRFGFDLEVVEIGNDEDGEPVTSCVAAEVADGRTDGSGRTAASGRKQLSDAEAVALRTIANLIAEHGEPLPQGTGFPSGGGYHGVKSSHVLSTLKGSNYNDLSDDAARKRWERLRTKLHRCGLIGVNGGFVWQPDAGTGSD